MGVIYSIVFINLYYSLCMLNTTGICILGSKYCYDGSKIHVAHIVEQYLPYQPRVQQESYICKLLHKRWQDRLRGAPADKAHNPLICIPGSPGSGKSTFLVNFPLSPSYRGYLQERYSTIADPPQPIVALYSLADLYSKEAELGLRILYGALTSMGIWGEHPIQYEQFCTIVLGTKNTLPSSITVQEVVDILWKYFGKDRSILLLQDNIDCIQDNQQKQTILTDICNIMSKYNSIDLITTTTSPHCMYDMITKQNQRKVEYVGLGTLPRGSENKVVLAPQPRGNENKVVLAPLPRGSENKVVQTLTRQWADYIRDRYEADTGRAMNREVFRLLTGAYTMAGHYPGTVVAMLQWFQQCIHTKQLVFTTAELENTSTLLTTLSRNILTILSQIINTTLTAPCLQSIEQYGLSKQGVHYEEGCFHSDRVLISGQDHSLGRLHTAIHAAEVVVLCELFKSDSSGSNYNSSNSVSDNSSSSCGGSRSNKSSSKSIGSTGIRSGAKDSNSGGSTSSDTSTDISKYRNIADFQAIFLNSLLPLI